MTAKSKGFLIDDVSRAMKKLENHTNDYVRVGGEGLF